MGQWEVRPFVGVHHPSTALYRSYRLNVNTKSKIAAWLLFGKRFGAFKFYAPFVSHSMVQIAGSKRSEFWNAAIGEVLSEGADGDVEMKVVGIGNDFVFVGSGEYELK